MKLRLLTVVLATLICYSFTGPTTPAFSPCIDCKIYTPNAFSPNDDGINDEFRPLAGEGCSFTNFQLKIFDRNGSLVFQSNSSDEAWDGRFRNEPAPIAVYYYIFSYTATTEQGEEKEIETGEVSLLR